MTPSAGPLRRLTRIERRILAAAAEGFVPAGVPGCHPAGGAEAGVAAKVEGYFQDGPLQLWWFLRGALLMLDLLAIGYADPPATFKNLDGRRRAAVLRALDAHPVYAVRQAYVFLKLFCCMFYYETPEVAAHLGATWPCARPPSSAS